jgi:membrane protease YdiL (CAAX protease family)
MGRANQLGKDQILRYKYALSFTVVLLLIADNWLFKTAGWARIGWGIVMFIALLWIYGYSKLQISDIGLAKSKLYSGLVLALKMVAVYTLFLLIAFLVAKDLFKDPRYHHSVGRALYTSLIILPLKTVLFEELVFRGIIPAIFDKLRGVKFAIVGSAILFGLWHLATGLGLNGDLKSNNIVLPGFVILAFIFMVTSVAGLILGYLRYKSDSLLTPIIIHWFINASALILAAASWLR